jgi:hypothetical protein
MKNKKRGKKSKPNKNFIKGRGKQKNKPKNAFFFKDPCGLQKPPLKNLKLEISK